MSGCMNMELGRLLHDYELDMLSAEDKNRFELHLYECDHCLSLVREFMDVSRIIRHDLDAQKTVQENAGGQHVTIRRTRSGLSPFTRYLIAAVFVIAIGVPAYWYSQRTEKPPVAQSLELLSSRGGGSDIIYLEKGGQVEISFYFAESYQGEADLIISSIEGDTVLYTPGFKSFNDQGLGSITVPVSVFSGGHYMLTIRPDPETGFEERVYMFTVK